MKHLLKLLTLVIVGAFVLNSCDDVPAPYPIPTTDANASQDNGTTGTDLATVNFVSGQGNWTIEDKSNNGIWSHDSQYGMKASAYKSGSKLASESWLLSPEIDLTNTTGAVMVVKEAINKIDAGDPNEMMSVLASTDNGTTWEVLTADARPAGTSWDMQEDKFDLSAYDGKKIKVAFKYVSTTESAGTWEIQSVKIEGEGTATIEGNDTPTPTPTPTGENLLVNGDFETWANDLPTHWKSASAAGNASLSQEADDVHGGDFAVAIAGVASANKRMAYEEITLKAGTYKFSLFAKSTTTDKSQTRVGYVTVVNGTADSQGYKYGDYVNLNNNDWTECSTTFTLTAQTTICLVVMNPKTNGEYSVAQTILVDDASLVTSDGGIADGDDSGDDNGDDGNIEHITVAEFLSKADTQTTYELTGTVQNIKNTTYGNFDLVEGDASIYIYGLLDLEGKTKNFSSLGISEGDKITITGKYVLYNNTTPAIKNAQFIRKEE